MNTTLGKIAELVGAENVAEQFAALAVTGISDIEHAEPGDIIFAVEPHIEEAKNTKATAVILPLALTVATAGLPL